MRSGLEAVLSDHPEIEIAHSPEDADVVISERLPDFASELPVVLLGDDLSAADLRSPIRAVLPRKALAEQIAAAIHAAAAGLIAIPAGEEIPLNRIPEQDGVVERLTARELDVLEMLAEGLSNKMIAYRLSMSEHTAKFHVNSILAKLRSGTRTEAVMRGVRLGLIKI
jgi:DNA-binding NarL/FixJ family response regulator